MDIGGRKMTGFASGVIDSFQYFGATLGLWGSATFSINTAGKRIFPYMIPFGIIGFCLMIFGETLSPVDRSDNAAAGSALETGNHSENR